MTQRALPSDLFAGGAHMIAEEAVDLTIQSLNGYGACHQHWAVAWSGGKDSTATVTLLVRLIEEGRVIRPKALSVFYADTRQELPPLQAAADRIAVQLRQRDWITVETVRAPMDKRFLVYILGRGVPPPNNNTLRWCTRQIKVDPMAVAIERRLSEISDNVLMITGVRLGESAVRDRRIEMSCSKDGGAPRPSRRRPAECRRGRTHPRADRGRDVAERLGWRRAYGRHADRSCVRRWDRAAIADRWHGMSTLQLLIYEAMNLGGTPTCAGGCDWQSDAARACPHGSGSCSQGAYVCSRCGDVDYGYEGGPGWRDCEHGDCSIEAWLILQEKRLSRANWETVAT